jgi:voltage-gated potassium channel
MRVVHDVLHTEEPTTRWAKFIRAFTAIMILLSVVAVMLESVAAIHAAYGAELHVFDLVSVAVFTSEYVLRLWSCPIEYGHLPAWRARLKYAFSFFGMIDLLAVAPFYLQAFFIGDLRVIRGLRLLRLERLFLLGRYTKGFHMLGRAIERTKHELYASFAVIMMLLMISATVIYFIEHEVQHDKFSSIPESLWWGIITLTSVGYGDIYPITPVGKLFAGIISLLGVGLAALPSGLIASGFVQEFKESKADVADAEGHVCCPACHHEFRVGLTMSEEVPTAAAGSPVPETLT